MLAAGTSVKELYKIFEADEEEIKNKCKYSLKRKKDIRNVEEVKWCAKATS